MEAIAIIGWTFAVVFALGLIATLRQLDKALTGWEAANDTLDILLNKLRENR